MNFKCWWAIMGLTHKISSKEKSWVKRGYVLNHGCTTDMSVWWDMESRYAHWNHKTALQCFTIWHLHWLTEFLLHLPFSHFFPAGMACLSVSRPCQSLNDTQTQALSEKLLLCQGLQLRAPTLALGLLAGMPVSQQYGVQGQQALFSFCCLCPSQNFCTILAMAYAELISWN